MKKRNEKLIAMLDSVRSEYKGDIRCKGIICDECPLWNKEGCYLTKGTTYFDLDKAIEIIDNYEIPIKEYTLEELENLPRGTMVEVSHDGETWFEREFVAFHKGIIFTINEKNNSGCWQRARPIQEVANGKNN